MILSIILFIPVITSIPVLILLLILGLFPYTIIPTILFCCFYVLFRIWFYYRCKKYIDLNKNIIKINYFIKTNNKKEGTICFNSFDGKYLCKNNNGEFIKFDLKGFLLKKSFIRAFVVRQIRYKVVSNKLKISKLFLLKLKGKYKYDKLYLIIDNHKYLVFSNGVSRNTIISSEISKSKYGSLYNSVRTYFGGNVVEEVNERIYLNKYKCFLTFKPVAENKKQ